MAERTVTLGSVSKEFRMIGWRIGWAVGPTDISARIVWTHTYNVVTPPGLTQSGAEAALRAGDGAGVAETTAELQRRRDEVVHQLSHLPLVIPEGGWSLLVDADAMGTTAGALSEALLTHGKVAATAMQGWGDVVAPRYVRLVFAREPVARLAELRHRFGAAGF
ncbi:aminotransferase class I/II-fold pyridoxal phosphate-dependent enzyme [Phytoactinopolyspora mesophila]|uniref:Aminotransferase class I/II-fold pyridoxal phosphate-dependent enzyme n=1 Tax=Phytoactinopolyspora mesophila TaxID=2650750 RepID=A0A7K3M3U8_9ACTN|nr:aminotransferase class I/II-fold pyridoxal phosphate-dependent enzyme [Phytoactinopolyspora mesophila]NDL57108.1 aminotransferase class I/II-fold pyridoxal phosphate-dependent enzyme [Phytoactinopolyspora mesophila]